MWIQNYQFHRIYYRPKVSSFFFFPLGFIYRWFGNNVWSLVISDYFYKTTNQLWIENSKMTGLKNCKRWQENVSLSLAKRKLAEKNAMKIWKKWMEIFKSIRWGHVCFHIPHKSKKKLLFFRLTYLEYNFMTGNLVRLNLAVLKTSETSQEHTCGGVLC